MVSEVATLINGRTQFMGLLGEQISYTLSPAIHNHAAKSLGLNLVYLPFPCPAAQVGGFLRVAWEMGAIGFNVTTPHKSLAATLIPGCHQSSINTIYRGVDWWHAASTDGPGFIKGLEHMGASIGEFEDVIFLGDGGVVAAILAHIAALQGSKELSRLPRVSILARSGQVKEELTLNWPDAGLLRFAALDVQSLKAAIRNAPNALLIQATSAPHRGEDLSYLLPALSKFRGAFCDLVYGYSSNLLLDCKRAGLRAQDGRAMLIEQARLSQQLWWGQAASYDELEAALNLGPAR